MTDKQMDEAHDIPEPPASGESVKKFSLLAQKNADSAWVLDYTNYRGERKFYRVQPRELWFGSSHFHRGKDQFFLAAFDVDRRCERDFVVCDIHDVSMSAAK